MDIIYIYDYDLYIMFIYTNEHWKCKKFKVSSEFIIKKYFILIDLNTLFFQVLQSGFNIQSKKIKIRS